MSDIAIRVENLGKLYRIGQREPYYALRDQLMHSLTLPFRGLSRLFHPQSSHLNSPSAIRNPQSEFIWALRDVSFEVKRGEVVGIIGRNGAGKSTLLKILSRVTEPTEGCAEIHGRVGSLLEVGTGFHPELTGRENIYLNGAILGMKRREMDRKFDEIVAFAEVEKFIDTPVKHYSSGMYLRLAFSVAAHLEPEILLVDEVLAVGDAAFQKKCLGKMGDVAKRGRTVLFVSHNMGAVGNLCDRAILLSSGQIKMAGPVVQVIDRYVAEAIYNDTSTPVTRRLDRTGDGRIKFVGLHWENSKGDVVSILRSGGDYQLVLSYECADGQCKSNVLVSFAIKDHLGVFLLLHQTNFNNHNFFGIPPRGRFICRIPKFPLVAGEYLMNIFVGINEEPSDLIEDVARITVEAGDFFGSGHPGRPTLCKILVECNWELQY